MGTWQVTLSNGRQYTVSVEDSHIKIFEKIRAEFKALGLWDREVGFSSGVTVQKSIYIYPDRINVP